MTDAFECDRCGDLFGAPPEIELATNTLEESGGNVNLKKEDKSERGIGSFSLRKVPIWYYGFCMNCGADVEVLYQYDGTEEVDRL